MEQTVSDFFSPPPPTALSPSLPRTSPALHRTPLPSKPLKILRLPFLAQQKILFGMNTKEIVELSLLSKESRKVVKSACSKRFGQSIYLNPSWDRVEIELFCLNRSVYDEMTFGAERLRKLEYDYGFSNHIEVSSRTIDGLTVPSRGITKTYWKDPVEGGLKISDFLMDLFGQNIEKFVVKLEYKSEIIPVINWMNQRKLRIEKFEFFMEKESDDSFTQSLMESVNVTKELKIKVPVGEKINYEREFDLDKIDIYGNIKLHNLNKMDCKEIVIRGGLRCQDVNSFLNNWRTGRHKKLEMLRIYIGKKHRPNVWERLTNGIPIFENKRCKKTSKITDETIQLYIQSENGVKAKIKKRWEGAWMMARSSKPTFRPDTVGMYYIEMLVEGHERFSY